MPIAPVVLLLLAADAGAPASDAALKPVPAAALQAPPPAAERAPSEAGLATLEVLGAAGAAVAGIVGAYAVGDPLNWNRGGRDSLAAGVLAILPALEGTVVCGVGKLSAHYEGGCSWPVAGAYLGMAPFVGLAFLGAAFNQDALGAGIVAAASLGAGLLIAAPIGATWAWNARKTRRPAPALGAPPAAPLLPGALRPSAGLTREVPPSMVIPLVAVRF